MDWKVHDDGTSTQWWLVNDPSLERYGSLTVSKTVSGNAGDKEREFNFTVTLSDKTISGTFGDMEFKDGVASFSLKHGDSKTAIGLPINITYTVTENEANQDGYIMTAEGTEGTIVKGKVAEVKFTNTKHADTSPVEPTEPTNPTEPTDPTEPTNPTEPEILTDSPETGDDKNLPVLISLMSVSIIGLGSVLLIQKQRRNKAE